MPTLLIVTLYSIGHSNRSFDELLALLQAHCVTTLADIRRFPGSRRHPHFNRDSLEKSLPLHGIQYVWLAELGGRRKADPASTNLGLTNESFRAYADYLQTAAFHAAVEELLALVVKRPTVMMCAESLFWQCHRRLVSDYLLSRGITVQHIMNLGPTRPHTLTQGAVLHPDGVSYPLPLLANKE